jgi:HAD superfamily hydrolase (TIGR01490 family)
MEPKQKISIFDFDRTLSRLPSWTPFLLFAVLRISPWRVVLLPFVLIPLSLYGARLISRGRLKEMMQALVLGPRVPSARMASISNAFADRMLTSGLFAEGVDLIHAEQAAGHVVMIATASCEFYMRAIADRLGVADLVSTKMLESDGFLLARILGQNCYGDAKLAMIEQHFQEGIDRANAHISFYSDHISDLPAFEWADEPIAVNASRALGAHARTAGWRVMEWRS